MKFEKYLNAFGFLWYVHHAASAQRLWSPNMWGTTISNFDVSSSSELCFEEIAYIKHLVTYEIVPVGFSCLWSLASLYSCFVKFFFRWFLSCFFEGMESHSLVEPQWWNHYQRVWSEPHIHLPSSEITLLKPYLAPWPYYNLKHKN